MIVCEGVRERLELIWCRLQKVEEGRVGHSISQIDLDERCVARLERLADNLEAEDAEDRGRPGSRRSRRAGGGV